MSISHNLSFSFLHYDKDQERQLCLILFYFISVYRSNAIWRDEELNIFCLDYFNCASRNFHKRYVLAPPPPQKKRGKKM